MAHEGGTSGRADGTHAGVLLAGRYEVEAEIGSGATAITYRGRDTRLNRLVAIKILRRDLALDTTYVQRFEREAHIAASINHGNVVNVFDFGQQDDALYIVMQYVDGEDLKHLIVRENGIDVDRARRITIQVLAGLSAIHAGGILHRDIKPQNVLIGTDGVARLADFGVAHLPVDTGLTTVGTTVGTAAYMAPEQAQAGDLTEATDIYPVGVMLFEMLTGALPFNGLTPLAMMLAHVQQAPEAPSVRRPDRDIPRHLDNIVLQAMAKDPRERFRSASVMSRVVESTTATSADQATTMLPAAPRESTAQGTRALAGAAPAAAGAAWSVAERGAPRAQAARPAARGQEQGGMRVALGALMVLLLIAMAAVATFLAYDYLQNNSSGDDPTPTVPAVAPTATGTADEETPTESSGEIAPSEPTAIPTTEPTAEPTAEPTLEPTAEPTVLPPTAEPTEEPLPTPTPTPPLPTPTPTPEIVPIESDETDEPIEPSGGLPEEESTDLPVASWFGPDVDVDTDNGLVLIGPQEAGTVSFDLPSAPTSETIELSLLGLTIGQDDISFTVQVNGSDAGVFDSVMPRYDGEGGAPVYDVMSVSLPSDLFVAGTNELTILNGSDRAMSRWLQPGQDKKDEKEKKRDEGELDVGQSNPTVQVELGTIVVNSATLTYDRDVTSD